MKNYSLNIAELCQKGKFVLIKKGSKAPIGDGWQKGGSSLKTAQAYLNRGKSADRKEVGAIGILCGPKSAGLLMIDHDGESCDRLLKKWGVELPSGPIVSSGRLGHHQQPFWVPEIYWEGIQTTKFRTGANGPDGKPELLELRWDGCQSLVLGNHPDPGKIYTWTNEQLPIPMAPLELLEKMLTAQKQPKSATTPEVLGDKERALSYLEFIDPTPLDWYTWRNCLFACHSAGLSESEVLNWSERSAAHTERGFSDVWRHIKGRPGVGIGTLGYLAKLNGWKSPLGSKATEARNSAGDAGDAGDLSAKPKNDDNRTEIIIYPGIVDSLAREVLNKLAESHQIYRQGGTDGQYLTRVIKDGDSDVLDVLTTESLQCELNRRFAFKKEVRGPNGKTEPVPLDCPASLAKHISQLGAWSQLPKLTGVVNHPQILRTGEIVDKPGYCPKTGLLLRFDPEEFAGRPAKPTRQDAVVALNLLIDWLGEFPFQSDLHRSCALALVLTALSRRAFETAPMFAISATKRGTGKGALAKNVGFLVTGSKPGSIPYTSDSEEFRKKITSVLRIGGSVLNLDNVSTPIGGDVIEMILTEPFFRDRLLGGNQMPSFSTQMLVMANGNNLQVKRDMTRRIILIYLDAEDEFPEHRFFERDLDTYTEQNRGALVNAGLTVLQAYLLAGSPEVKQPRLGSFGQWSDLVRSALIWLGQPDPVESQKEVDAQDDEKGTLAAFLECWLLRHGTEGLTARALIEYAIQDSKSELKGILLDICLGKDGQFSPRLLGYYLRKHHRSVVNGMRLEECGKDRTMSVKWAVKKVETKKSERPLSSPASPAPKERVYIEQGFEGAGDDFASPASPAWAFDATGKSAGDDFVSPAPSKPCLVKGDENHAGDAGDENPQSDFLSTEAENAPLKIPALDDFIDWEVVA
jgi:Bifunctional DNA primase/polymerase, N-terminal/Primase C terminal 2 (PriCT-2)